MKKSTQLLSFIALTTFGLNPIFAQDKYQTVSSRLFKNKIEALQEAPRPNSNRALCAVEMICEDDDVITNVNFGIINNTTDCSAGGYGDYRIMTTTIQAGTTTPVSVTVGAGWSTESVGLWIDLNNDETFTIDEYQYIGVGTGSTVNGSFFIPSNTEPGVYVARFVVYAGTLDGTEGCGLGVVDYGEYEDYSIQVTASAPCSTLPTSITATPNTTTLCPSDFLGFVMDYSPEAAGMTYQVQSSTDGTNWTNVGSPFNNLYNSIIVPNPTESTQYRVVLTCAETNSSVNSNIINVTLSSIEDCYCVPEGLDCTDNDNILSVSITETGYTNTSDCGAGAYTFYDANPITDLVAGNTYTMNVQVGDGFSSESVSIWVDYNEDGIFGADEFLLLGTGSGSTVTNSWTIPATVENGIYRMRVRVAAVGAGSATSDLACDDSQGYGETEDYLLYIGTGLGVNKQELENISIFPNPTNGSIQITGIEANSVINLVDVTGRVIETMNVNAGVSPVISLEKYSAGTYTVSIANENGSIVKRVVRN